ncbi:hypothetical protein [Enterococcus xiangfangensis]|uniref:hypothetical protein n=1 Tax=Enterococcus xiangfangensis TaxID=1296537 RepID=UPI0010F91D93|nr:hypothetical protein [Enterococcus xiangfangensis]MBM7711230.1 hypothetical protein [Enterococcus xiangfangensis]NBK07940.1 hypothetical protein [Enterococcus asini]
MNQPVVSNEITVSKPTAEVKTFLGVIDSLLLWDSEVTVVKNNSTTFTITRSKNAVNSTEEVTIEKLENQVIYHFIGEKLTYDIQFILNEKEMTTQIIENVILINKENFFLPVQLFRPILKAALEEKLINLAQILNQSGNVGLTK